jgi:hypothetical protein
VTRLRAVVFIVTGMYMDYINTGIQRIDELNNSSILMRVQVLTYFLQVLLPAEIR